MPIERVLVVDDELLIRSFLAETLTRKELDVSLAENGKQALAQMKDETFDLVFTDMKMPDMTGLDLLRKIREQSPSTIIVIITAFGTIENAVEAMRLGAFHYLIKPFSPDMIEAVVEKAKQHISIVRENQYLRQEVSGFMGAPSALVAESPVMKQMLQGLKRIAQSNANVMITGESGTGKEVVSNTIHFSSLRANKPFIRVNCAAIPDALVESEFFGHEKGSFTGALAKRCGRFELAHEGTLLLDEITEVPIHLQAKLLRAVQEREFERVGGTKPVSVDVRIISTSNRNMAEAIRDKVLREDLYYRLNVIPVHIPPLRERREDIIPLAELFLKEFCQRNHKKAKQLTREAKQRLMDYPWPGNVRELGNIIERAIVIDLADKIEAEHLYMDQVVPLERLSAPAVQAEVVIPKGLTLDELEKRYIIETLQAQQNNRALAAKHLGITLKALQNKLSEYDMPS